MLEVYIRGTVVDDNTSIFHFIGGNVYYKRKRFGKKASRKKIIRKRNCTIVIIPKKRSYKRRW